MFKTQMLAICNCSSELGSKMEKVLWQIAFSPSRVLHLDELACVPEAAKLYLCFEKCKVLGLRKMAPQQQNHTVSCAPLDDPELLQ